MPTPCPVPMPCTVPVPCTLPTLDKSRLPRPYSIMVVVLPESELASRRRGDQDAAEAGNILPSNWSKAHGLLLHPGPVPVDHGIDSSAILARGVWWYCILISSSSANALSEIGDWHANSQLSQKHA